MNEDHLYYFNCGLNESKLNLYYPSERKEDKESYDLGIIAGLKEQNIDLTLEEYIKKCMVNFQK